MQSRGDVINVRLHATIITSMHMAIAYVVAGSRNQWLPCAWVTAQRITHYQALRPCNGAVHKKIVYMQWDHKTMI